MTSSQLLEQLLVVMAAQVFYEALISCFPGLTIMASKKISYLAPKYLTREGEQNDPS